jgi:hypothetical protein
VGEQELRRSTRLRKPNNKYKGEDFVALSMEVDPTYEEAMNSNEKSSWLKAMKTEYNSLIENET